MTNEERLRKALDCVNKIRAVLKNAQSDLDRCISDLGRKNDPPKGRGAA